MEENRSNGEMQSTIEKLRAEIEECKAQQARLLNAAQQWRDIFDNINDILCMTGKNGEIIRCNKSMQRYLNRPFTEILGKNVHDLLHPGTEPPERCPVTAVSASLKREVAELKIHGRSYIVIADPLFDTSGAYTAIVHTMIDITDREKLSGQLKETNEFLRNIIESSSSISLISTDLEHHITYWNKGAENIFGYQAKEVIGKPVDIIYAKDAAEGQKIKSVREEVLVNRKEMNSEVQQRRKDGSTVWINLTISPRISNENEVIGAIGIGENITEHKLAEQEKRRLEDILLQTQKMEAIGTLAGGVAHDFNNLLTVIRGNVDLLAMGIGENVPLFRDLKEISLATARATNLTRQLLLFSRKQPMGFAFCNLNRVINDLIKMLGRLIGENIRIATDFAVNLHTVRADEGNLEQVITNLVVNARDAMPEGGTISIKTENVTLGKEECKVIPESYSGHFVRLSVQDTGTGMSRDIMQHIFEPFFTTKKPGEGTGLGLSVIYGIIKQHDGWINVYSEPGQGAVFKVYLPAGTAKEEKKTKKELLPQILKGRGERILIVEDEEMICTFARKVLTDNGYEVFDAQTAKGALEVFKKEKKNLKLVISDMILPDMVGLKLVDALLSLSPRLRVMFTSGYMDDKSHWPTIQEKGYYFLQKPFGINELLTAVRETLDKDTI